MIVLQGLLVGLIGNVGMDLGQQLMRVGLKWPITDWGIIGRWAAYLPQGKLIHTDIGDATPVGYEQPLGWVVHYIVGPTYGVVYLFLVEVVFDGSPGFWWAMGFAIAILVVTWFVVQPSLGAGFAASNTPDPWVTRLHDLGSHVAYGLGLYIGGLLV
jgi:Protein of unknown function (DUF2938)